MTTVRAAKNLIPVRDPRWFVATGESGEEIVLASGAIKSCLAVILGLDAREFAKHALVDRSGELNDSLIESAKNLEFKD